MAFDEVGQVRAQNPLTQLMKLYSYIYQFISLSF